MKSKKRAAISSFIVLLAAIAILILAFRGKPKDAASGPGLNYAFIEPGDDEAAIVRKAASIVPSPRQADWQARELTAFAHFGMNTFTDREWGEGTEDPKLFNPSDFDALQWAQAMKDAGMKTLIVTAKHHDGFCLWPSALTDHSVKSSPWRDGQGDVVGEVALACRAAGLGFGVYLSPWDRHERSYGDSPRYNEHFRGQLRELLTNYGPVAEVWFDGACAEGPNGKKQVYDWPSYYKVIREIQPDAVIAIMGPDVRWVGTESGYGRETEWSVVPVDIADPAAVASASRREPLDGAFTPKDLTKEDLGGRDAIRAAKSLIWYPAETDVSIRPGWFYHAGQDDQVKTPAKLVDIYFSSVGRNGVLLLNIPPDKRGLIHENDVAALRGMRRILDASFASDAAAGAKARADTRAGGHGAELILDGDPATYWRAEPRATTGEIILRLAGERTFDCAMLQEALSVGQRIEAFRLEAKTGSGWKEFARGTTIGAKRLLRFPKVTASEIRIVIEASRLNPTLASFGLFTMAAE
ncbi:MAG: alpha-L-fucosidase [Acidobacteriota bacterium]|nr:alpha-L-fucosidase [Acidobacteriota bacterium]